MQTAARESGACPPKELLQALHKLAPDVPVEELVAATLQLHRATAHREDRHADFSEIHRQLADLTRLPVQTVSAQLEGQPSSASAAQQIASDNALSDPDCSSLVDSKLQLLFELWDRDGDGSLAFSEVALAFRKFCPAMQRLQNTAADAAEAIFLFGNGELQLNRIEFGRLIHSFCGAIDMSRDALLDLLIMLAAVDDRPAEEMTFLLAESALQQKYAAIHTQAEETASHSTGPSASAAR